MCPKMCVMYMLVQKMCVGDLLVYMIVQKICVGVYACAKDVCCVYACAICVMNSRLSPQPAQRSVLIK